MRKGGKEEGDQPQGMVSGEADSCMQGNHLQPFETTLPSTMTSNPVVDGDMEITCFSEDIHDGVLNYQIIRLPKQIYVWIGCNSAKLGHLYAATTTRPNNAPTVTSLRGGSADNTGSTMAGRLVKKTGLSIILACNLPKNAPSLEVRAEKILMGKLRTLGYIGTVCDGPSHPSSQVN
ncbi:uncharacterized protein [Aristolochia californica]|uniref:uncharacterized protein isoform X2 n=1 Tax=Aristolochia californica TaxID=171875 RepID=UPI0035DBB03A